MNAPRGLVRLRLFAGLLLMSATASAFRFGVPPAPGQPTDGWFVLVGTDAVGLDSRPFLGDITGELHIFIEATGRDLDLCVWDPGQYDPLLPPIAGCTAPSGCQLDFAVDPASPPSQMSFELFEVGNPVALKADSTTYGPDTAATDNASWCFWSLAGDGQLPAIGLYELVVRMADGPSLDQHVNVFGVETRQDYDGYVYYATVGHSTHSGAALASNSVRLHPWAVSGSPALDAGGLEACGLDIVQYDLDAATLGAAPPDGEILTRLNWSDGFGPTGDSQFRTYRWVNMAGKNFADDHGIYSLTFRFLTASDGVIDASLSPPLDDFNAFEVQVWDFGQIVPFFYSDFPIAPPDPRAATHRPRRLYLPTNSGAAPVKEFVAHLVTNAPVGGDYEMGLMDTIDVTLSIENPTGYDMTNLVGRTVINPSADLADPSNFGGVGGTGRVVTPVGKVIDFTFTQLGAGQTATITYSVDATPSALGPLFLTGDGSDFGGGADRTQLAWDTPFATSETARPCMIEINVVPQPCTITAAGAGPGAQVCQDESFVLDGSTSGQVSCSFGALEYRWSGPGITAPTFSTDPTVMAQSSTSGLNDYTLDVRCASEPTCTDTTIAQVDVSLGVLPLADAGGDRSEGSCDVPFMITTQVSTGSFTYLWSTTSPVGIGALLDDPTLAEPNFIHGVVGAYDLTLTVLSDGDPILCTSQDAITVDITDGAPSGALGNVLLALDMAGDVELRWPLGILSVDRYNVHGVLDDKTALDKTALPGSYTAPILNGSAIVTGTYTDVGAIQPGVYYYEAYGRSCTGTSIFP